MEVVQRLQQPIADKMQAHPPRASEHDSEPTL
jgi:hypothetical protein